MLYSASSSPVDPGDVINEQPHQKNAGDFYRPQRDSLHRLHERYNRAQRGCEVIRAVNGDSFIAREGTPLQPWR